MKSSDQERNGIRFYSEITKSTGLLTELADKRKEGDEEVNVIEDRAEICKRVVKKYKVLCRDNGYKSKYVISQEGLINIKSKDIKFALKNLNFKKATGWDYIPGQVFKLILEETKNDEAERDEFTANLAILCNELLGNNELPEEVFSTRLICFNKNATCLGDIDAIRPIGINGVLSKMIEIVIRKHLRKHIYGKKLISSKQIGFVQGLGCEVNLIRLRELALKLMKKGTVSTKFVMFIDFRQAYDSVNHEILFRKLEEMKVPGKLINSIRKMLSFANMKMEVDGEVIWINRGEIQGSMLSPDLFNIYINDLIELLEKANLNPIAYADDLAVMCDGEENLFKAMDIIEKWSGLNDIEVNKKKSGILIIQNQRGNEEHIRGYPVKNWYKFLGVRLDYNLSPMIHLTKVRELLDVYTKRNEWLLKEYFSPKSLVQLCQYFQCSRLSYGMCTFFEDPRVMEKLEVTRMILLRSIMKMADNVSSNRFRMAINVPKMEYELFLRLKKVIEKYKKHFNEEPVIYRKIMAAYYDEISDYIGSRAEELEDNVLKSVTKKWSIVKLGRKEEVTIGDNFFAVTMKKLYKYIDKREFSLIKYMVKSSFLAGRGSFQCELCGVELNRKHVTNECPYVDEERRRIKSLLGVEAGEDLEDRIIRVYYDMNEEDVKRSKEILEGIKSFVCQLFIKRGELNEMEKEKRRSKESDIATGAEARQKRLKTPATENDNSSNDEEEPTVEGNNAGATGSGRKTAVAAEIDMKKVSVEDGPEGKSPNAVTKQKKIVPKKTRKEGKDN